MTAYILDSNLLDNAFSMFDRRTELNQNIVWNLKCIVG